MTLLLGSLLLGPGCAPEDLDFGDGEVAPEGIVLSARIGPAGGTLEGLDGFRLEIPAGALSEELEIAVRPTSDATPLAATAERVGPAFALTPADLALAAPARVTLPFDRELRDAWEVADADCRVWQRQGEGWERREQVASSPDGVTVELERLSVVAAGVLRTSRPLTCTTGGCATLERAAEQVCLSGTTMCMRRSGTLGHVPMETASLTVENGKVYYLFSPATDSYNIGTFQIGTIPVIGQYTALVAQPTAAVGSVGRIHLGLNEDAWVGLTGLGNVRFRPSSVAARFDTGVVSSPAGVVIEDANRGNVVRLSRLVLGTEVQYTALTSTASWEVVRLPSSNLLRARAIGTGSATLPDPFQFFATVAGEGVFGVRRAASARTDACGSALTLNSDASQHALWVACSDNRLVARDAGGTQTVTSPSRVGSFALDTTAGGLAYATDPSRAELVVAGRASLEGSSLTARAFPLTDAAPGTAEHTRMLPRAVRYDAARDLVVLITAGSEGRPEVWTMTPQSIVVP